MIKNSIVDVGSGKEAQVNNASFYENESPNGLTVYSEPRRIWDSKVSFFTNPTYGADMNVNGAVAGAGGEPVHDGTDTVAWTGLNTGGTGFTFASIANPYTGTKNVAYSGVDKDKATFTKPAAGTIDAGNFVSLTFWVYLTTWSVGNTIRIRVKDTGGVTLGTALLENFINPTLLLQWQQVSIPVGVGGFGMVAGNLISFLEWRVKTGGGATHPVFDLDDMEWSVSGAGALGPTSFSITPTKGKITKVDGIRIFMSDAYAGTLLNNSMPVLPYDSFLAIASLSIGLQVKITRRGSIVFNQFVKQLGDLMSLPNGVIVNSGSDGTNTWFSYLYKFDVPIVLLPDYNDKMTITVNDNLSGLLQFRVSSTILEERK